jgi:hypothetical protein
MKVGCWFSINRLRVFEIVSGQVTIRVFNGEAGGLKFSRLLGLGD